MPILLALPSSTKFSTALPRSGGQDADSPDERARLVQNVDGPGFGSPLQGPEQGSVRPVQLRATRLPTLQDRELVAQDQDPGCLLRLLAPDSRSLTCIILSPIAPAGMRTYKPRGEGLNSYPPTHFTRDHSSAGNGDGNVPWRWYNMKVQSRSCTAGIGPNDVQTFCLCH
jgi:hypothetical protein